MGALRPAVEALTAAGLLNNSSSVMRRQMPREILARATGSGRDGSCRDVMACLCRAARGQELPPPPAGER